MTALSLTLAYLALHIPLWKYQQSIETWQSEVQILTAEAEPVLQLIERVNQRHQVLDNLTDYKRRVYPMTDVLLELTNLASDNTWLKSLERIDNKVILRGESKQTSTFIECLERSPMFQNVYPSSPAVAIPGTLYERFHLSVTLTSKDDK
ncbi:MAG: PilN domain-containing protein [Pseudomonadota bacterium]